VADQLGLVDQAGSILLYVAPGFFARLSYRARFPQAKPPDLYTLVVSVAASVPIVALGQLAAKTLGIDRTPTTIGYVLLLLVIAVVLGFGAAWLRSRDWVRGCLRCAGIPYSPEATVMEQTVMNMRKGTEVTITFKDGRIASGFPVAGTGLQEEGEARELYLVWPRWWDVGSGDAGDWIGNPAWQGLLVNLDEVAAVMLSDNPLRG
jgi:hypothetical protein